MRIENWFAGRLARNGLAAALLAVVVALPAPAHAAAEVALDPAGNDIHNLASLQRGARNFMNYCSGCHSAQYVRYNRMAEDLGIPEAVLKQNLMFTSDRPFDTIKSAMSAEDGRRWFGNAPPDLSLMARSRGPDYIYTFLRSFYVDPSRPAGTNNLVLPGTAMPHVLASLQGLQQLAKGGEHGGGEGEHGAVSKFELVSPGALKPAEYDEFVRDTVNFLEYIGEPVQAKRQQLGIWVMLFLLVFMVFSYLLYREYWKDVK